MRILLVTNRFPPDIAGGAEILAGGLVEALRRQGHTVVVLTSRSARCRGRQPGVARALRTAIDSNASRPRLARGAVSQSISFYRQMHSPASARALRHAVARVQPDVVYVWNVSGIGLVSLLHALRKVPMPVVFHLHSYWWQYINSPRTPFSRVRATWLKRLLIGSVPPLRFASAIVCSQALKREYRSSGCPEERIEVIPNAIDAHFLEPAAERAALGATLMYAGRLCAEKGVMTALHAVAAVRDGSHPEVRFLIYGKGDTRYEQALRQYVHERGLESAVSFEGLVRQEELVGAYDRADVVLVPSLWEEPFGLVAVEAMARGTAVVASDVGGLHDLIRDGRDGVLVAPGNASALGKAIRALLDEPAWRRQIGQQARARALRRHRFDVFATRVERHLERARRIEPHESRWVA